MSSTGTARLRAKSEATERTEGIGNKSVDMAISRLSQEEIVVAKTGVFGDFSLTKRVSFGRLRAAFGWSLRVWNATTGHKEGEVLCGCIVTCFMIFLP